MISNSLKFPENLKRRAFIGGSDARIIMGADEKALQRLWREKRGEAEPEDLSGNLSVQLGLGFRQRPGIESRNIPHTATGENLVPFVHLIASPA